MFETLQDRLSGIFDKLTGRGALSETDVDAAMREVRRALIEADVHHLPFPDGTFDLVIGRGILHHLDPDVALAEIHRVLKPDGTFWLAIGAAPTQYDALTWSNFLVANLLPVTIGNIDMVFRENPELFARNTAANLQTALILVSKRETFFTWRITLGRSLARAATRMPRMGENQWYSGSYNTPLRPIDRSNATSRPPTPWA